MGNMEIKNLDEARRIQEGVLNYYIGVICSGLYQQNNLPHLIFFEDVDDKGEPVFRKAEVIEILGATKEVVIKYKNGEKETINLSAINIDWLQDLANYQFRMYDLLEQGEPDTLPGCITYQIILSEFIDKYGCDDHEGRVLIGNKTNGEIITLMKELDDLSIDNQSDITFECGSFRVLEYSQGDAHYKLSEESLSQKLIDPGISEPYNKKCTALDDEFQFYVGNDFWEKSTLQKKLFILQEIFDVKL